MIRQLIFICRSIICLSNLKKCNLRFVEEGAKNYIIYVVKFIID